MLVVYVAGPFRGANSWEMEQNIRRAEELALEVWRAGFACISPHLNTRCFQGVLPDQVWLDGDLAILKKCDVLLMTPDWKRSAGATAEHEYALQLGMPVYHSLQELMQASQAG
jgi:nucleoside 2-deoxyribosyltransferase